MAGNGESNGHMGNNTNSNSLGHQFCQHMCDGLRCIHDKADSKKMLSLNEKKIQQIDSNLDHLRDDLVRFYSAFSTSPKETMANVLVAYEILMANPLATDELRKAAYKVRKFTTVEAMSVFDASVKTDSAIELRDTYQSSIDELGKASRQIVEEQNQKRANLLNDKSRRKLFRRIADSSK